MKVWIIAGAAISTALAATLLTPHGIHAQEIDREMMPVAGQYESRTQLISMNIPGLPPNMTDMMRGVLEKTIKICITPEEVEQGYREALKRTQDGECSYNRFSATGGTIDAELVCQTENGPMTMQMNGTGTPTTSDVTMEMTGDMGTGPGSMKMRVIQQRVGDC